MLTEAPSYRVKNHGKNRHKDFPEVSTDCSHGIPQLCTGRVMRLEMLWANSSCDLLLLLLLP